MGFGLAAMLATWIITESIPDHADRTEERSKTSEQLFPFIAQTGHAIIQGD